MLRTDIGHIRFKPYPSAASTVHPLEADWTLEDAMLQASSLEVICRNKYYGRKGNLGVLIQSEGLISQYISLQISSIVF